MASTIAGGGALVLTAFTPSAALAGPCVTAGAIVTCSGATATDTDIPIAVSSVIQFAQFNSNVNTATAAVTVHATNPGLIIQVDDDEGPPASPTSSTVVNANGDALDIINGFGALTTETSQTTTGNLQGGVNGIGLNIKDGAGPGNVDVTAEHAISGGLNGIQTQVAAGTTTITLSPGAVISATGGSAILATGTGFITVNGTGTVTGGTSGDGIQINGKGGVQVAVNGPISGDPGIDITDNSAVGINVLSGASGATTGIVTDELGTGSTLVEPPIGPGGAVTAVTGPAIEIDGGNNATVVTTGDVVSVTTGPGAGIIIGGTTAPTGNVVIDTTTVTTAGGSGISVPKAAGNITINTFGDTSGSTGANFGILAITKDSSGLVTVNTGGNVANGINAGGLNTGGTTTVNVSGNMTGKGVLVDDGTGAAANNITATVNLKAGNIAAATGDGIFINEDNTSQNVTTAVGTNITASAAGSNGIHMSNLTGFATTFTATVNGSVSGAANGIEMTNVGGPNIVTATLGTGITVTGGTGAGALLTGSGTTSFTIGTGDQISGATAGVSVTDSGVTGVTVTQTDTTDRTAQILATAGDGIDAIESATGTGGVTVTFIGNVGTALTPTAGIGVKAQIIKGADVNDVNVTSGNVTSNGVGIDARNFGAGNVSVTVVGGATVTANKADGINAVTNGGGNATVVLLGANVISAGTGVINAFVNVGAGNATIDQNGSITGPGEFAGTVTGAATVNVNGNIAGTGTFPGAEAHSAAGGPATVSLFNNTVPVGDPAQAQATAITITTVSSTGVLATDVGTATVSTATVNAQAGAGVLTMNANGALAAGVEASNAGIFGSLATVDLSNLAAGSSIAVNGGTNVGVEAISTGATAAGAGSATVTTGAGLTVNVGTATAGNGSTGVLASNNDNSLGSKASVTLGASNTVNVGHTGATASALVGVEAVDSHGGLDTVTVVGGAKDVVNVLGQAGVGAPLIGVEAVGVGGLATVTLGDGGAVTVTDTVGGFGNNVGVLAHSGLGGTASVSVGTTSVSDNNGEGIEASFAHNDSVTSNGNINASTTGIEASGNGTGTVTVNYNATGTQAATLTAGGHFGIDANNLGGAVNVVLGNGVGATTITVDSGLSSIGVRALTIGAGNASIHSNGGVTVDPTQYGMESITGSGQALIVTGVGDLYQVNDPVDVSSNGQHIGLFATTEQAAGTASALVQLATKTNIQVNFAVPPGNPLGGGVGIAAVDNGGGDVKVVGTGSIGILVGGQNSAGILATTIGGNGAGTFFTDGSGSLGKVTVNLGTGLISVGTTDTNGGDLTKNFSQAYGIYANTLGGSVSVTTGTSILVENGPGMGTIGIYANTIGDGVINVAYGNGGDPSIVTTNGDGIFASHTGGGSGAVTVSTTGSITTGNVPGGFGNGIEATTLGAGDILVTQAATSTIATDGVGPGNPDVGIYAYNTGVNGGKVTVTTAGIIDTTEAGGGVSTATGLITVGGQGIIATTTGNGDVTVNQQPGGVILTGASDGIDAVNNSHKNGQVTVNGSGTVTSTGANAIVALVNTNDGVAVNLNGANVTGGAGFGVLADVIVGLSGTVNITTKGGSTVSGTTAALEAITNGTGDVKVNTSATDKFSSTTGTGIVAINQGFGNGSVTVNNAGSVTAAGKDGIFAEIVQFADNAAVSVSTGNVQSVGTGVLAETGGTGLVTVTVTGGSTVASSKADGVDALGLAGGNVQVATAAGSTTSGAVNGILGQAIGTGTTIVNSKGTVTGGTGAGISALTQNALDTVNVQAGAVSSAKGDGVHAVTSGSGSISITTNAGSTVTGGTGGSGIFASPGLSGQIDITLKGGASTIAPATNWGINAVGNNGAVNITETAPFGKVTDGGIRAVDTSTGVVTLNLSGSTTNTARQGVLAQTVLGSVNVNLIGSATVTANKVAGQNGVEEDSFTGPVNFNGAAGTTIVASGNGLLADATGAAGTVLVQENGAITAGTNGILAETTDPAGGTVTVQTGPGAIVATGATGTAGVLALSNGPSAVNVTSTGAVTGFSGVEAFGAGGNVNVNTSGPVKGTGGLTPLTPGSASVGVGAFTTGAGTVNVTTTALVTGAGDFGVIGADTGGGSITVATGAVNGNLIGVIGSSTGGGAVSVTTNGAVNTTGATALATGVEGGSTGGPVTIKTNSTVTSAATGVFGVSSGAGTVNIDTTGGLVTASGAGDFAVVGQTGAGALIITTGAVTGNGKGAGTTGVAGLSGAGAITINALGAVNATNVGITATSTTGVIAITTGSTVTATNDGIFATTGGKSITVTTGGAVTGSSGIVTDETGGAAGATTITTTAGLVTATSTSGFGISADPPNGPVTITTGAVTANAGGATSTATAVSGVSTGGPVLINTLGAIQGGIEGIVGTSGPASSVTVNTSSTVTASNGGGILVNAGSLGGFVNVGGNVTATDANSKNVGIGVSDTSTGVATVVVTGGSTVTSTGALATFGIFAQGGTGVTVDTTAGGKVTGQTTGISTTDAAGPTVITTGGAVVGTTADGIDAVSTGAGPITITTNAVTGAVNGISAVNKTGAITITNNGAVTGTSGFGVGGTTAGTGVIQVNVNAPIKDAVGISTAQTGSGVTNIVDTTAANTVTGTVGDGIQAVNGAGSGAVNVGSGTSSRFLANVTGATNGIDISGAGPMNVFTSSTIIGQAGWGILAKSTGAAVNIDVTGPVTGTAAGGKGGGIRGVTTGATAVNITSTTTVTGLGAGSDGIDGESAGAGAVTIASTGPLVTGANDAILAASAGGVVTVGTAAAPITSVLGDATTLNAAIQTQNTTGATVINTAASASMTGDVNAAFGIEAVSTSGAITIGNAAPITVKGTDISASATTGGAITVASSGALTATTGDGIDVNVNPAQASGNGTVTVGTTAAPITSNINVAVNGIDAQGGGVVSVVDSGSVTGKTGIGVAALSNSGAFANATVTVTTSGAIKDAGGVFAGSSGTDKGDSVTVTTTGPITSTAGTGIAAVGVNGLVTVNLNAAGVNATGGDGIVAATGATGTGSIVVNTVAGTTITASGAGFDGIFATITNAKSKGTITVNNAATITMPNGAFAGIQVAGAGTGTATVNNSGVIDPAAFGIIMSNGGNSNANTSANVTGGVGIANTTTGAAPFTAQTNVTGGAVITGLSGPAIEGFGTAGGNVGVDTHLGGNITGATTGILTRVTGGTGATTINTLTNGGNLTTTLVSGAAGDGVNASSTGSGAIKVTTGNASGAGAAGHISNGVVATSAGGGNVTVATTGQITGDLTGNAGGIGASGITAATSGGAGNASVTVNAPQQNIGTVAVPNLVNATTLVEGGNAGISAASSGAGATTVLVNGLGTGGGVIATGATTVNNGFGPVGIAAFGGTGGGKVGAATGVTVTTNTLVESANGRAIVTNSANNAVINVNAASVVVGLGDATAAFGGTSTTTHPVIEVVAVSGATTTINDAGMVGSVRALLGGTNATLVAGLSDLAIRGAGGSVVVNDTNDIDGRVDFSGVTGANTVTLNVSATGQWLTNGSNVLGPTGADTINNSGLIVTSTNQVATSIAFGAGSDTFNNNAGATLVVGADLTSSGTAAAPAVTTISGAVNFTNNGTIILGAPFGAFNSDGVINAVLLAKNTAFGGTGLIDLDANLWSTPQSAGACTGASLTAADCLVVGSSSGNNAIRVKDTGAHAFGAFNPTGITVVVGSSGAATFHLDAGSSFFDGNPADAFLFGGHTGVLNKPGMFFYDLSFFSSDATERLVSAPKAMAFEFASIGGAVDDLWYTTTQTWFDRQADLRDGLDARADGGKPAVWLKIIGDWTSRNHSDSLTLGSQTYVFNTSYNQDTSAIIGGVDLLDVTSKDKAFVIGIQGGEVDSDMRFRATPDRFKITGGDFGGYASYLDGGLFIDGTINANFLKLSGDIVGINGPPSTSAPTLVAGRVNSVGGQIEAGYQMPISGSFFWEPIGSLAYVNASFDNLQLPGSGGGTVALSNDRSFRGSLGARFGGEQDFQYYKVKLAITARVWDEFDGNTTSTMVVPSGPDFINGDSLRGVFGQVQGEANLFTTTSGLSAFLNGGWKFKSNYSEGTITLGARYQW